jgi:hypothetical protein
MSNTHISPALRQRVSETSRYRCGYCLTSQRVIGPLLEIDHYIPESRGGSSEEENLWLACPICNKRKSDRIDTIDPESQTVVPIFNPRQQRWEEHFAWAEDGTVVQGLTAIGRATVAALQMNHPDIVAARQLWVSVGWHPPDD